MRFAICRIIVSQLRFLPQKLTERPIKTVNQICSSHVCHIRKSKHLISPAGMPVLAINHHCIPNPEERKTPKRVHGLNGNAVTNESLHTKEKEHQQCYCFLHFKRSSCTCSVPPSYRTLSIDRGFVTGLV